MLTVIPEGQEEAQIQTVKIRDMILKIVPGGKKHGELSNRTKSTGVGSDSEQRLYRRLSATGVNADPTGVCGKTSKSWQDRKKSPVTPLP